MPREFLTDYEVEAEIQRLSDSEYVQLARKERRLKVEKRKQKLYQLRNLDKRGRELADMGITLDNIKEVMFSEDSEERE